MLVSFNSVNVFSRNVVFLITRTNYAKQNLQILKLNQVLSYTY